MSFEEGLSLSAITKDGRRIVVSAPNTEGWNSYYTGAGDQKSPRVLGGGQEIYISFAGPADQSIEVSFSEPVEMHDGQAIYTPAANWSVQDKLNFSMILGATPSVANGGGTGNSNKYPIGGGLSFYIPAEGNGAWDINLATAVPVNSSGDNTGFWDVARDSGVVTPSATPGQAAFNLHDFPLEIFFVRKVPLGAPLGLFDVDAYKTQWIHQNWKIKINVVKVSVGAGEFSGWVLAYRKNTQ